jgi:hypothetical protein
VARGLEIIQVTDRWGHKCVGGRKMKSVEKSVFWEEGNGLFRGENLEGVGSPLEGKLFSIYSFNCRVKYGFVY